MVFCVTSYWKKRVSPKVEVIIFNTLEVVKTIISLDGEIFQCRVGITW